MIQATSTDQAQEYKGVTLQQFQDALYDLGERMFRLFDATGYEYDNDYRGTSLMWNCSFTASLCGRDAIDQSIERGCNLTDGLIYALMAIRDGQSRDDLQKLLTV